MNHDQHNGHADGAQPHAQPVEPAPQPVPAAQPNIQPLPVAAAPVAGGTNGLAVGALVVGIVAFLSGWVPFWGFIAGVTAVILGVIGLKKPGGKGLSIAGIVTGGLATLTGLVFVVLFIIGLVSAATVAPGLEKATNEIQSSLQESDKLAQNAIDGKKDFPKGATGQFEAFQVAITSVQRNYMPESTYLAPDKGREYIIVTLDVKNTSGEKRYIGGYDFDVLDGDETVTQSYLSIDKPLESTDLKPNERVTGSVAYEVTKDSTNLKLKYDTTVVLLSEGTTKDLTYTLAF